MRLVQTFAVALVLRSAALAADPWPGFMGDNGRTGYQAVSWAATRVRWRVPIPGGVSQGGISIGDDGRIYFKTNFRTGHGSDRVYALDEADGRVAWASEELGGTTGNYSGVALGPSYVYATTNDEVRPRIVALRREDGSIAWENDFADVPDPAVSARGTPLLGSVPYEGGHVHVYITDRPNGRILCFDAETGAFLWAYRSDLLAASFSALGQIGPAFALDGLQALAHFGNGFRAGVLLVDQGDDYEALWEDGGPELAPNVVWWGSGAIDAARERIYLPTFWDNGPSMWAIDVETGDPLYWLPRLGDHDGDPATPPLNNNHYSRAAVGSDGTLYVGANPSGDAAAPTLFAYTDAGDAFEVKWTVGFGRMDEGVTVATTNGYVYTVGTSGTLYVVRDDGTEGTPLAEIDISAWPPDDPPAPDPGFAHSPPAIDADGSVYVGTTFAFYDPQGGPYPDNLVVRIDPPLAGFGDFDADGDIDAEDEAYLRGRLGTPSLGCPADVDRDGDVDEEDLAAFPPPEIRFRRADANEDGRHDIGDAIKALNHLFGGEAVGCPKSVDADDNGRLDIGDAVSLLNYLFASGPAPAAPFPDCGTDPSEDDLECEAFEGC